MEGGSGPWRGHRGRKRPSAPARKQEREADPEGWKRVEDPPAPPPAATPVAAPVGTRRRAASPRSAHDAAPGKATPTLPEKHVERAFLVCAVAYVLILFDVIYGGAATWFDGHVMTAVAVLPDALRAVSGLLLSLPGERWLLAILIMLVALRAWSRGSTRRAVLLGGSTFSIMLFIEITKRIVGRTRPTTFFAGTDWLPEWLFSTSNAFPSGHSGVPVLVYGLVLIALWGPGPTRDSLLPMPRRFPSKALAAAVLLAFLPGLGRILWGFHWFSDVLAGWLLGLAWLAATLLVANVWGRSRKADEEPEGGEVEPNRPGLGGLYD